MGHIFKVEWWEKHPSGCSFGLFIGMEIGKGKEALIGIHLLK